MAGGYGEYMKYVYIFIALTILGCANSNFCFIQNEDITNMYSIYVDEWKQDCVTSFNKAEKEVFKKPEPPKPSDGTNPDSSKCICKGTGIIVQGDGHKTVCPYHGKVSNKR